MQKWEYKSMSIERGFYLNQARPWATAFNLNELGAEGWELVSVVPLSSLLSKPLPGDMGGTSAGFTSELFFYFKRPVKE